MSLLLANRAVQIADLYVSVNVYGAVGDGTTDDATAIQNCINAETYIKFSTGYNYATNSTIEVPAGKFILIESGANVRPKDSNFESGGEYNINNKDRKIIFKITGDNVTFNGKGTINGKQDVLTPYFSTCVFLELVDNFTLLELNVINTHNACMAVECDSCDFNNISYTAPYATGDYQNACLDLSFCTNITGSGFYCEDGEEVVDLNGENQYITLNDLDGVDLQDAIIAINSSKNITIDGVDGTYLTKMISVYDYPVGTSYSPSRTLTMLNEDISISNITGFDDISSSGDYAGTIVRPIELLGEWLFTGNANDSSGNGNNGSVTGATLTTDRKSASNSAYSFNGSSDYINFGNILDLGVDARTYCCWVYPTGGAGTFRGIFGKTTTVTANKLAFGIMPTNVFLCQFVTSTGTNLNLFSLSTVTLNKWYFLVCVITRAYIYFYLANYTDGDTSLTLQDSADMTSLIRYNFTAARNMYAGIIPIDTTPGNFYTGKIDDIRIYDGVLSSTEIQALYNE